MPLALQSAAASVNLHDALAGLTLLIKVVCKQAKDTGLASKIDQALVSWSA